MRLDDLLRDAARRLAAAGSPSARLDAEVLLCHVLGVDRTWLYTWGDRDAAADAETRFDALVAEREAGQPVAHLTGEREFWGLALATSPSTLIPRADTETLVEAALALAPEASGRLLDLGTGTGAVALAFASERPAWTVVGVDLRLEAVALARRNATRLGIDNADFLSSDWFAALGGEHFDLIVANPPYLADDDPHLGQGDVRFEPRSALVAAEGGLADLYHLIEGGRAHLVPGGWLLLEHGATQGPAVREALCAAGYAAVTSRVDLAGHERVSLGCR
ncbi:peptide chain release factor N(5)-glutamine methyltransferase [Halomonas nitroreducens]|uniref:Release factor glutamine methyltransferase n=1 Tax=Halomonas nitroreducens TaxID=447425 RepID=A0A3S0HRT7_9GAMM|nr:peptide chain release factor N(5)-glutamine methyltransferase [Halomonas nitroreducens]RTR02346.1 peptide chain release factor N(5)-glutamine methyltransferase [Halomonas nitroreducens]